MNYSSHHTRCLRRPIGVVTPYTTNILHLRNPWITAAWSVLFPGFGQLSLGFYIKGFILMTWEIFINLQAHINSAILFTFQGDFEQAKSVLDKRWAFLYIPVYLYAAWASYRSAVDLNKFALLAVSEKSPVIPFSINTFEINFLDKRTPWVSALFSAFAPGTGHFYTHRVPIGFFFFLWWIAIAYYSRLLDAIYFTAIFSFSRATGILHAEWFLFVPSILGFTIYDSYVNTVEYNKLFQTEQGEFLESNYQCTSYKMPI